MPSSVKKQCNDFVTQYGDAVIQLLIETLKPNDICPMLKLCNNQSIETMHGKFFSKHCNLIRSFQNNPLFLLKLWCLECSLFCAFGFNYFIYMISDEMILQVHIFFYNLICYKLIICVVKHLKFIFWQLIYVLVHTLPYNNFNFYVFIEGFW